MERWKSIPGYEDTYQVSDEGRVRSVARTVHYSNGQVRSIPERLLKPGVTKAGYLLVCLYAQKRSKSFNVHSLVAERFVPGYQPGLEVCHKNGNPADGRASNLRWGTPSSNSLDKRAHGTDHNVNKTHCPQGHPYSPENTYHAPRTPFSRACRECKRIESAERYRRKRDHGRHQ